MQDSITMAEVGSIVKVSGSRMATPLGPPRPGSTPTKMPSTSPTIISDSVLKVSRTPKPWMSSPNASIAWASITEEGFERPLRHDHVEGDVEGNEHDERENKGDQHRLPPGDAADPSHEAGDQQKARDVEPEPLREQAVQEGGDEHLSHAPELVARHENLVFVGATHQQRDQAE